MAGAGGPGVGEHGGDLAESDGVADLVGDLVGVDGGDPVQVQDRSDGDVAVVGGQELPQLGGEDRSEAGVVGADDTGAGGQGLVGQVHVQHDPGAGSLKSLLGEQVGESGQVETQS